LHLQLPPSPLPLPPPDNTNVFSKPISNPNPQSKPRREPKGNSKFVPFSAAGAKNKNAKGGGDGGFTGADATTPAASAANESGKSKIWNCLSCGKIHKTSQSICRFCSWDRALSVPPTTAIGKELNAEFESIPTEAELQLKEKARAHKNRLLEFDKNAAKRTSVYDDQEDYFTSADSGWLTTEERAEKAKLEAKRFEDLHTHQRTIQLSVDFAGRKIIDMNSESEKRKKLVSDVTGTSLDYEDDLGEVLKGMSLGKACCFAFLLQCHIPTNPTFY
jgi:hypothetical protein